MMVRVRRFSAVAAVMLLSVTLGAPKAFGVSRSTAAVASAASPIEYTLLPDGSWSAFDIRGTFGGPPVKGAVPFVDPLTNFQNAYGVVPSAVGSDLVEYTRMPAGNWISLDITATFHGIPVLAGAVPFVDPLTNFQNVYATDGHDLIEYTRLAAGNWISLDVSRAFNLAATIAFNPAPFVDPLTNLQNVYARNPVSLGLIEFTRLPAGNWVALDITQAFSTAALNAPPVPFTDPITNNQIVFGTPQNHVTVWIRKADGSWISKDLSAIFHLTGADSLQPVVDPGDHTLTLYASVADHVFELARLADLSWVQADITSFFNLIPAGFGTAPFVGGGLLKLFSFNHGTGDLIVYKRAADGTWSSADLTTLFHVPALLNVPSVFTIVDPLTKFLNVYGDQPA